MRGDTALGAKDVLIYHCRDKNMLLSSRCDENFIFRDGNISCFEALSFNENILIVIGTDTGWLHVHRDDFSSFSHPILLFENGSAVSIIKAFHENLFILSKATNDLLVIPLQTLFDSKLGSRSFVYHLPGGYINDFCIVGPRKPCNQWPSGIHARPKFIDQSEHIHILTAGKDPGFQLLALIPVVTPNPVAATAETLKRGLGNTRTWISNYLFATDTHKIEENNYVETKLASKSHQSTCHRGSISLPGGVLFDDPGRIFDQIIPDKTGSIDENYQYLIVDKEHGRLLLFDTLLGIVTCTFKGLRGYEIGLFSNFSVESITLIAHHRTRKIIDRINLDSRTGNISILSRRNVKPFDVTLIRDSAEVGNYLSNKSMHFCSLIDDGKKTSLTVYSLNSDELYYC